MLNQQKFKREIAFTLFELLLCLAIIGILLPISIPSLSIFADKNALNQTAKQFLHALNLARTSAISRNKVVTFCKSNDGLQCQGQWIQGSIVFIDDNANGKVDGDDELIYRVESILKTGSIRWRAFQNKQYIQMTPLGYTNNLNGNFTFCPASKDATLAQQIVINRTGRVRVAIDVNHDGIKEDSKGEPLSC